jgi:basic amino acid/polyamine antiporter, APA family
MDLQPKKLRLFDLTMIVISLVIGMGIFKTPVNVAQNALTPLIYFSAWFLGGIIALSGALTYAEIGSRYPVTGGYYKIFSACYHPSVAFAINSIILVSNAASVAAVALVGSEYISNVALTDAQNTSEAKMWVAGICIALFYGLNLLGLRTSSFVQNLLMLFKIGLMLLIISVMFISPDANNGTSALTTATSSYGWADLGYALGVCLVAVSFTYGGYQQSINFGAEVKDSTRIMPKAIGIGIGVIILLYMVINYAYYRVIGFEQLGNSESIGALMASKIFGASGFQVVSWLFFFSVLGYVNVMLLANPRVMFAMSEEGTMPASFRDQHPKTKVLTTALTVFTVATIFTLLYAQEFDKILDYIMFLDSIGMAFSAATIFFFRKRDLKPEGKAVYKIPFYPILPIFYIAAYIFIAASVFVKKPDAAINGLIIFAAFFGAFWVAYFWKFGFKRN